MGIRLLYVLKVIDLFAGAGGLSLGFKKTGKYEIAAAFEINQNAQKTYKKNHPGTEVFSDVCSADFKKLKRKLGKIDVVIGGPPCQGFSMANRQKNHVISQNNMLVKQYVRAVMELEPKAFVMENVEMLKSDVHRFYLRTDEAELINEYNIETTSSEILLLEEEYFSEEIAEDICSLHEVEARLWSEEEYKLLNIAYRQRKNLKKCKEALFRYQKKYLKLAEKIKQADNNGVYECFDAAADAIFDFFDEKIDADQVVKRIEKTIMIQRCLSRIKEIYDNELQIDEIICQNGITAVIQSYSVLEYITKMLGNYTFNMGVLNALEFGAPQRRNRFVFIGIKKKIAKTIEMPIGTFTEDNYRTVKDAIKDIENVQTVFEASEDIGTELTDDYEATSLTPYLRDSKRLYNHIITQTRDVAKARFEALSQGENFHSLAAALKENTYTDVSRTQNTIYQRLNYEKPSGTVLNVRKSMWIHPTINRAVKNDEEADIYMTLERLIENWENEIVEFKEANEDYDKDKIGKYFSAISNEANLKGVQFGWLVFGVRNKDKKIIGSNYRDKKGLDTLKGEISQNSTGGISFIEIYEIYPIVDNEEKRVLLFQIPAAAVAIPTGWKDHYYGRNGESLGALSIEEQDRIRGQERKDWSKQTIPNATINCLNKDAIRIAKEKYKEKMNRPHISDEVNNMTDEEFLTKTKLIINGKITNAALLLLGNEDYDYLFNSAPEASWRLYDSKDDVKDYEIFKIPFITLSDRIFQKIRNLTYRYMPNQLTLFPMETKQYDMWLLRELMNNCIAHSDYTM